MACSLLGDIAMAADLGVKLSPTALMDASAGIAIGSRKGLGMVKHIDTIFLWAQEVVASGRLKVGKRATGDMLADLLTKAVPEATMDKLLIGWASPTEWEGMPWH